MNVNNSNSQTWPWFQPPPRNHQQPLPLPPFVDPFMIQQLLGSQANIMEGGAPMQDPYSSPFSVGPVYQGMAQQHQHQHQYQYRAPSSGPSRNRRSKGRRKTEAQYPYHTIHELSGEIARDHPTSIHPVYIWMGTFNNPGDGGAWRPPSRNPSMVNHNSTRMAPYDRDRAGTSRTRRRRSDNVDLSIYEIPVVRSERSTTTGSSNITAINTALTPTIFSTSMHTPISSTFTPPSSKSTSIASSEMSDEDATTTNTSVQEQPLEDDDFDTISLGSDIDYQY